MLLIESHFRFKKTIKRKKPTLDLTAQEKRDLKMVMESLERENSNKMLDQSVHDLVEIVGSEEEAKEIVAERLRLATLFKKVIKFIK